MQYDEVPKHKKARKKKRWVVTWRWTGDQSLLTGLARMLKSPSTQRYVTERAAKQAITDWKAGRGVYGNMRRPPEWTATARETN